MKTDPQKAQVAVLLAHRSSGREKIASVVEIRVADRLLREGRISDATYETLVSGVVGKVASRFYAEPPARLRRAQRTVMRRLLAVTSKRTVEIG